jgi:hypothetical protein
MAKTDAPIPSCKYCHMTDWERQEDDGRVTTVYRLDLKGVWRVMDVSYGNSDISFCCRNCGELLTSEKKATVLRNLPVDHI